MYIYEGHMGGLYTSEYDIDYDDLYCEQCGDSDRLICVASCQEDLLKSMADEIAVSPSDGGYYLDYILDFAHECFLEEERIGRKRAKELIASSKFAHT